MAEDKSKTVIVKARAKAFLTSQPEENDPLAAGSAQKKAMPKTQKSAPKAAEIAAAIRKGEISEKVKSTTGTSAADMNKSAATVVMKQEPVINRKNKLTEGGRVKKIPACKMAEPMKRPADDTLIITGKVVAASKRIQTPVAAVKSSAEKTEPKKAEEVKTEPKKTETKPAAKKAEPKKAETKAVAKKAEPKKTETKAVAKKAEPKKAEAKPAAKKAEPKKAETKPAVKKAEPKKAETKPAAKKAEPKKVGTKPAAKKSEMVQNTYIQYHNDTYNQADIVALAEKLWTKDMKKKAADLKTLELYIKPQEKMVYCVFNKKETGSFSI